MKGQIEGRKDRQTLLYRALLATARGKTRAKAVDWQSEMQSKMLV